MPVAPEPEMLWEPDDAHRVLADRFGHRDAGAATAWVSAMARHWWGLDVLGCDRLVMSAGNALAWLRTSDGERVLKWCVDPARFERLAQVAALTTWLGERAVPVSPPVPAHDGRLQVEEDGVSMALQRVVGGDMLDVADPQQVHAAGAVLAHLHQQLACYPDRGTALSPAEPDPVATGVTRWLDRADHVPPSARALLRALVADAPTEPSHQLLHGDVRSSNLLWAGARITAVLDLEEARLGACVDEVARAAVLLGTRFRGWGPVAPHVRARFRAGYESVRPFTAAESAWWPLLELRSSWTMVPPGDDPTGWRAAAEDLTRATSVHRHT